MDEDVHTSQHHFISFDETSIYYRRIRPVLLSDIKTKIFILHGFGEHGGRYAALASFLAGRGYDCWMPDLRGFGKSGGHRGCARNIQDLKMDLTALLRFADKNSKRCPHFYLGHSFGGLLASYTASLKEDRNLKGLILSSPLFGLAVKISAWQKLLGHAASFLAPEFTQNAPIRPEHLTHDPETLKDRADDPLIHFRISARLYTEMLTMMSQSGIIAAKVDCPTLILQAGDDRIVSKEATGLFFDALKATDKEMELYRGWFHELLNETNRQLIYGRIFDWLNRHI